MFVCTSHSAFSDYNAFIDRHIERLESPDLFQRYWGAGNLGRFREKRGIAPLTRLLQTDPVPGIRKKVAQALGEIGDKKAIEPLISALQDKWTVVRRAAIVALGKIGDERAINPLKYLAKNDPDKQLRKIAQKTLLSITSR